MEIFKSPLIGRGSTTLKTPLAHGTAGQVMVTDGPDGNLSFATGGAAPGGSGTELQRRSGATTLAAVTGSSFSSGTLVLPRTDIGQTYTTDSISDASYETMYQLRLRNTGDASGANDYHNEVRLIMQAGTAANHRRYIGYADFDGEIAWLQGVNASSVTILYSRHATGSNHRMWFEASGIGGAYPGGNSYLCSGGTGIVKINYDLFESAGTGGFQVWSGGELGANVLRFGVTGAGVTAINGVTTINSVAGFPLTVQRNGVNALVVNATTGIGINTGVATIGAALEIVSTGDLFPSGWNNNLKLSGAYPAFWMHDTSTNNGALISFDAGVMSFWRESAGVLNAGEPLLKVSTEMVVNAIATNTHAMVVGGGSSVSSAHVNSGQILLGLDTSERGSLSYNWNDAILRIDNNYNSTIADIEFRTRTTGTPLTPLIVRGTGAVTIATYLTISATQPAAVADATGGAVVDVEARAAINTLLARERAKGSIAT